MRVARVTAALAAAILSAGCAFSRGEAQAEFGVVLDPPAAAASRQAWQLVIEAPHALEPLSGERIVMAAPDGELTVLPGVRWRERAPELVRSVLLEAFDACACIAAVARDGGVMRGDYVLTGELRHFELRDEDGEPPLAIVDLTLTLVRRTDGGVQATRRFQQSARAEVRDARAGISALGQALNAAVAEALPWALDAMGGGSSPRG